MTTRSHCLLFHKRSTDWDSPLGYKQVISHYTRRISLLLTLVLGFASDSCNNNDILLVAGYNYNIHNIYLYIHFIHTHTHTRTHTHTHTHTHNMYNIIYYMHAYSYIATLLLFIKKLFSLKVLNMQVLASYAY